MELCLITSIPGFRYLPILNVFLGNLGWGTPTSDSIRSPLPSPDPHSQPWISPTSHGLAPPQAKSCGQWEDTGAYSHHPPSYHTPQPGLSEAYSLQPFLTPALGPNLWRKPPCHLAQEALATSQNTFLLPAIPLPSMALTGALLPRPSWLPPPFQSLWGPFPLSRSPTPPSLLLPLRLEICSALPSQNPRLLPLSSIHLPLPPPLPSATLAVSAPHPFTILHPVGAQLGPGTGPHCLLSGLSS